MEITRAQLFSMAATIMAGIMANPANGNLSHDQYGQQTAMVNVLNSLEQVMMQKGIMVVA